MTKIGWDPKSFPAITVIYHTIRAVFAPKLEEVRLRQQAGLCVAQAIQTIKGGRTAK